MNKVFTTFKFVSTYPQLNQFIKEAHDYEELSSERSFKNWRSGGTYSDKDIDKKLEEIENKLTEKIYKYLVDNNTYIITFDDAKQQLIIGKSDKEINDLINTYNYSQLIKDDGYDINSIELFKDWFNNNDYINIDRNANRVKEDIKVKKENKRISLEEATLQALADEANSIPNKDIEEIEEPDEAEGIMDGIIVVTDPETDTKDYEEIIEKAQDIMENTPEGEIPFDEEYLGQYMMTCPLCGTTFIEPEILEPGATCPVCLDTPESFIVVGKVEGDDEVNEDMEEVQEPAALPDLNMEDEEEPLPEEPLNNEEDNKEQSELERDIASKEVPQGNILTEENKLTEAEEEIEKITIKGLENFENEASKFKNYPAYKENFGPLVIVKNNKIYYIFKETAKDYNDYIDYTTSKDYIEGWMMGAIKANNKMLENLQENEKKEIAEIEDQLENDKTLKGDEKVDLENDIKDIKNKADKEKRHLTEVINQDGFENNEELQKYFQGLNELPDEIEIDGIEYKAEQYGGEDNNLYIIYTDVNNNDSYIKVFYSLNENGEDSYKGIKEIKGVSDLRENKDLEEKYDPSKFDSLDEELSYLYARIDEKENEMAARYVKDANITNPDILDREIENSLNKDDGYKAIINRIQEIENLKQQK